MARRAALMRLAMVDSETIRPPQTEFEQIVPAHQKIAVLDQKHQEIEYLRLDRQQYGASAELAPIYVERIIVK